MANIIQTKEQLETLHSFLEELRHDKLSESFLTNFYTAFILKDENNQPLTNIIKTKDSKGRLSYSITENALAVNFQSFLISINYIKKIIYYQYPQKDFLNYIAIYILLHELEHSYQGLIMADIKASPSKMLKSGYDLLNNFFFEPFTLNFFKNLKTLKYKFLYNLKSASLVLERNANVEALYTVYNLSLLEGNQNLSSVLEKLALAQAIIGYEKNLNGAVIESAKTIGKLAYLEGYEELENMPYLIKVRYGLPIEEQDYQQLYDLSLKIFK